MTYLAGSLPAVVITASPTLQPPWRSRILIHSSWMALLSARWMAPSTPPPPKSDELAALTMASTCNLVLSSLTNSILLAVIQSLQMLQKFVCHRDARFCVSTIRFRHQKPVWQDLREIYW